jgi:hypothetical protein
MAIATFDDIVNRIGGGFGAWQPLWGEGATGGNPLGGNNMAYGRLAWTMLPPSLPGGVTDYFIASAFLTSTIGIQPAMLAKLVNFGSLNISTNVFTDGSTMPNVAELGNAAAIVAGPVFMEVTTILNGTPGSITITYTNQAGTGGQVSVSQALTATTPVRVGGMITLAAGDTGVRDITAAARTGGTTPTGVIKFYGVIPIGMFGPFQNSSLTMRNLLTSGFHPYKVGASDEIGVIGMSGSSFSSRQTVGGIYLVGGS